MKKLNLIYCFVFLATLFMSCSSEDDTQQQTSISNEPISAMIEKEAYTIGSVNVKKETSFNEEGHMFYVYNTNVDCSSNTTSPLRKVPSTVAVSKIEFFLKGDKLEKGRFEGKGPYVQIKDGTKTYNGVDLEITEVTDTTVKGKVFGGSKSDGTYVEGVFTANICAQTLDATPIKD